MKNNRRLLLIVLVMIVVITVGVVLSKRLNNQAEAAFLEKYQFTGLSVEEIVKRLDSTTADPMGLRASITGESLVLMDESNEVQLPLPSDKFYLSFAPYVTQTHPCGIHSLSGCQGELINEEVQAVIIDSNGKEIINSHLITMANGFVGVWLPRNIEATVTVRYNGLIAEAPITTYADSDTCLTTPLRLN